MIPDTPECFANHMGLWLCEPTWLSQALSAIRTFAQPQLEARASSDEYHLTRDKVAVVAMNGPMMKGDSKFGGANTVQVRRTLRAAANEKGVRGILLVIDSPGGHVAGTQALADDVRSIAESGLPIHAHIEDMGASAAYWVASQANRVTANATAHIGSIGVLSVLEDISGAAEREGIKVHVISTGAFKGAGAPGAPVTEAHLDYMQEVVDDTFEHFLGAVAHGRGLKGSALEAVSDGKTHIAAKAHRLGLIDGIMSAEAAMTNMAAPRRRRAEAALAEFRANLSSRPVD